MHRQNAMITTVAAAALLTMPLPAMASTGDELFVAMIFYPVLFLIPLAILILFVAGLIWLATSGGASVREEGAGRRTDVIETSDDSPPATLLDVLPIMLCAIVTVAPMLFLLHAWPVLVALILVFFLVSLTLWLKSWSRGR